MSVYISGPISGKADMNRPAFDRAQFFLEGRGHQVINPHTLNGHLPDDLERSVYMRRDITVMLLSTAIFMLEGWEFSRGARCEFLVAQELGLDILYDEKASRFDVASIPSIDWLRMPELTEDPPPSSLDATQTAEAVQTLDQEPSDPPSALSDALGLVYGARQDAYAHPLDNFTQIADMLNPLWKSKLRVPLTAHDVAPMMIITKLSRHSHSWKYDNLVDIAGYAETDLRVALEQERRDATSDES